MDFGIKLPSGFIETETLCACGGRLWKLPSGEVQTLCPDCQCKTLDSEMQKSIESDERKWMIPALYDGCDWSTTNVCREQFAACKKWADEFAIGECLAIVGSQGTGKTCASHLIAHELIKKGITSTHIRQADLYACYLNRHDDGQLGNDSRSKLYELDTSNVLIIDEFGYLQATEASRQYFRALHVRLHDAGDKSIIIVSNFGDDVITKFFDADRYNGKSWTKILFRGDTMRKK